MLISHKELVEREAKALAKYAIKSKASLGRRHREVIEDERLCFQRDKDRIIHCKAFRRLDQKTQVFMAGSGDHYRTRLTHTLEVAQISRDLARRLSLNEDLCEAIALAHDLGHPPFGHGGEEALNEIMENFGGHFEHNEQSRRIVEKLEKVFPGFEGLNLTLETLDGMIKHQTAYDQSGRVFEISAHLEAQMVNLADEIAYTNHDMDDGLRSGILELDELRKFALWERGEAEVQKKYGKDLDHDVYVSRMISTIISLMVVDLCRQTSHNLEAHKITSVENVKTFKGNLAHFSPEMRLMLTGIRQFLYDKFYMHPEVMSFITRGKMMIKKLFEFYLKQPQAMPIRTRSSEDSLEVRVKDYIAGMTDHFLVAEFEKHIGKM